MGVQGLERYLMTTHSRACPRVSIAEVAQKYRKETGQDRAVAVVDGGLLMYAEAACADQLYGGPFKLIAERMVAFASRLQAVGVTPVFYFKGAPSEGRLNVWQERKQTQLDRVNGAFVSIASWRPPPPQKEGSAEESANAKVSHKDSAAGDGVAEATTVAATPAQARLVQARLAQATPVEATPMEASPVEATPIEATPVEATPIEATPVEATPVKATPIEATPVEATPIEATPIEATPIEATPVEATPVQADTVLPVQDQPEEDSPAQTAAVDSVADQGQFQRGGYRGSARGSARGRGTFSGRGGRDASSSFSHRGRSDLQFPQRGRGVRGAARGARGYHQQRGGTRPPHRGGHDTVLPPGAYTCVKLALRKAGFQVLISVRELDVEMAQYCRRHGCFALVSRDSDFVAMETAHYYLSAGHLDEAMRTVHFDRDAIARALGLGHRGQLPLLMALLPNGCVPASYLIPLHAKAGGTRLELLSPALHYRLENIIPRLAQLVRNRLWNMSAADAVLAVLEKSLSEYPARLLCDFAKQLGFEDSWAFREALRLQLEASLAAHDYTPPQGEAPPPPRASPELAPPADGDTTVLLQALARHESLQFVTPTVLVLLQKCVWEENCALEDPSLPAACSSAEALRPLRRRLYAVVLRDRPAALVREFFAPNRLAEGAKPEPLDVPPAQLDLDVAPHPGLLSLWTGEGEDLDAVRWRLLSWCLCPAAPRPDVAPLVERLRALPRRHAVPAAALFALWHSGTLDACLEGHARAEAARVQEAARAEAARVEAARVKAAAVEQASVPAPSSDAETPAATVESTEGEALAAQAAEMSLASAEVSPANTEKSPASAEVSPASTEKSPASAELSPASTEKSPASTEKSPPSVEVSPASATPAEMLVEYRPKSAEEIVRLFALTVILAEKLTAAEVGQLPRPRPQRLAVHLSALFLRACSHLCILNDALGAPVPTDEVQPADFFDGKLLHSLLNQDCSQESDDAAAEAIVRAVCCPDPCRQCRGPRNEVYAVPASVPGEEKADKALGAEQPSPSSEVTCEE